MDIFDLRISRGDFSFSASHALLTPLGMESLHGHSYRIAVILRGTANQYGFVLDFRDLKSALRTVIKTLNEFILVPTNDLLRVDRTLGSRNVSISYKETTFSLPENQVLQLPIINITSELLAKYIAEQVLNSIDSIDEAQVLSFTVEVCESEGQSASYTLNRDKREKE